MGPTEFKSENRFPEGLRASLRSATIDALDSVRGSLFEVLRAKMLKLLSKPWLENDSAALDESIKSLLQFTDDELSELSYGVQNI